MSLFNAFGNVSHGIADNIGSSTDPTTPLIYRYTGTEQTSWSVGGSVTLPLETLFDLPGKIKPTTHSGRYRRIEKTTGI